MIDPCWAIQNPNGAFPTFGIALSRISRKRMPQPSEIVAQIPSMKSTTRRLCVQYEDAEAAGSLSFIGLEEVWCVKARGGFSSLSRLSCVQLKLRATKAVRSTVQFLFLRQSLSTRLTKLLRANQEFLPTLATRCRPL